MPLDTDLATELDYFRLLRRQKNITKAAYERQKKRDVRLYRRSAMNLAASEKTTG
jgi:hypothetical protein